MSSSVKQTFFDRLNSREPLTIALIAHDGKKKEIVDFSVEYKYLLSNPIFSLVATGTTGLRIHEATHLEVTRFLSGPLGGDAQIGSRVVEGKIDVVIFITDPLSSQPHEPDIQGLIRVCNLQGVPLATNIPSAKVLLEFIGDKLGVKKS
eukprot:TRINITY_DN4313_c0_g1_i1.p1 TRINITY_DN4313_c0_g1~~TRINITY_DN4313_c0_g1_i1.p1  ORF type:complete len:149 (+),score=22.41 TRINITY_DN4313_c0_g1_i1:265-711(+)